METATANPTNETPAAPKTKPRKARKAKPEVKSETNGKPRARKEGLRLPQVRILKALPAGRRLSRAQIIEKITQDGKATAIGDALGCKDPELRKARDASVGYKSLLSLGYAKQVDLDHDGRAETVYESTAAGRKALEKAK